MSEEIKHDDDACQQDDGCACLCDWCQERDETTSARTLTSDVKD